jgi:hypothetical protein
MCFQVIQDYHSGALQYSGCCGAEYKTTMKSVLLFSKWYKIKLLEGSNFGDIQSIGCITNTTPVGLEPGAILFRRSYNNVYVTEYNSINYLPHTHHYSGVVT